MKKSLWLIGVVVVAIVVATFSSNNSAKNQDTDALRIGVLTSFTGTFAIAGPEFQRGIELALDNLTMDGKRPNIDVVYEDDQSLDPKASVNAAQKLLNSDYIDIGLIPSDIMAKMVSPMFNDKKIPLLIFWDANREVDNMGSYVFSSGYVTELAGERMAAFSLEDLKVKTAYVVSSNDQWGKVTSAAFKEKFESNGGKILGFDEVNPGVTDFRTILAKVRAARPDALYFPISSPASLTAIVKQSKDIGLKASFLTGDWFLPDVVIKDLGASANGIYFTNVYTPKASEINQMYRAKYGSDPVVTDWVSFTYDAVHLIAKAHTKSIENRSSLVDELAGTSIDGTGGSISIGNKSVQNKRVESVFKVVDGVPQRIP